MRKKGLNDVTDTTANRESDELPPETESSSCNCLHDQGGESQRSPKNLDSGSNNVKGAATETGRDVVCNNNTISNSLKLQKQPLSVGDEQCIMKVKSCSSPRGHHDDGTTTNDKDHDKKNHIENGNSKVHIDEVVST